MTIGETIYLFRMEKGMSQEALAEEVGVSRQSVSKWETGASIPDTEYVVKMAKLFGVSIDDLLLGKTPHAQEVSEARESENEGDMSEETQKKQEREEERKTCRTLSIVGFILSFLVCIAGLVVSAVAAWREGRLGEVGHLSVAGISVGATLTGFLLQFLILYLLRIALVGGM